MRHCILIVDDNAVNLLLASIVLKRAGYCVLQAGDAQETIQTVRDAVPDLILMDISLPGVDGLTLTCQLKSEARLAAVPIVAFSALSTYEDEQKAREAGCAGYIRKPINTREFPLQVAAFLSNGR